MFRRLAGLARWLYRLVWPPLSDDPLARPVCRNPHREISFRELAEFDHIIDASYDLADIASIIRVFEDFQ